MCGISRWGTNPEGINAQHAQPKPVLHKINKAITKEQESDPQDNNNTKTSKDGSAQKNIAIYTSEPGQIQIGVHDEGYLDAENEIMADKIPLNQNQDIEDAIAGAKINPGVEIVVIDAAGKARLHSLTIIDDFYEENKVINVDQLKTPKNQDGPLIIEDNTAKKLKGEAAFIVDQNNKVAYIGADADKTTPETALKDAEKYLKNPDKNKLNIAYQIVDKFDKKQALEVKFANNILTDFQKSGNIESLSVSISFLKPGKVKTELENLVKALKTNSSGKEEKINNIKNKINELSQSYEKEIKKPNDSYHTAEALFLNAQEEEGKKVATASKNLREAKMPGINKTEEELTVAKDNTVKAKETLDSKTGSKVYAENSLGNMEYTLTNKLTNLKQNNTGMESENKNMANSIKSYVNSRINNMENEISSNKSNISSLESDIRREEAKPNSKYRYHYSISKGKYEYGYDAFCDTQNNSKISSDKSKVDRLKSENRDFESDISRLRNFSNSINSGSKIESVNPSNLDSSDREKVNGYKNRYNSNVKVIAENKEKISDIEQNYDSNVNPLKQALITAKASEKTASENYQAVLNKETKLQEKKDKLEKSPLPDTNPNVKQYSALYQEALKHQENRVGLKAPLTEDMKDKSETVNKITEKYSDDKKNLNQQITDMEKGNAGKVKILIEELKKKLQ
jgi:hypothetical protein